MAASETGKSQAVGLQIRVVYQDQYLLVVDKPAGLVMHAGNGASQPTLADWARQHTTDPDAERPGIVHRLDKDTSGLVIIAKTAAAKASLQQQFKQRRVQKAYLVLVQGELARPQAIIELPLGRSRQNPIKQAVAPDGKPATTEYRVISRYPGYSLIVACPQTGRMHQLRVHLSHIGHPVVGDAVYGHAKLSGLKRQFLHAHRLEFISPSGQPVRVESGLPADLAAVIQLLGKPL